MREIKFRSFYDNRMHDNKEAMRILYNNSSENSLTPKYPIMQYTGIKDRNGKEIYRSDLIRDCLTMQVYEIKFGFCKKYAFSGWYAESNDGYTTSINNDSDSDKNNLIEVIGNIYENPELLK